MRQMSFALTTRQVLDRSKTVTRRLGWGTLTPGTLLQAIEKGQGLRKGEHVRKLAVIRVLTVTRERLDEFDFHEDDATLEGFPQMESEDFIGMFCAANGCTPSAWVNRIEFEYVEDGACV